MTGAAQRGQGGDARVSQQDQCHVATSHCDGFRLVSSFIS